MKGLYIIVFLTLIACKKEEKVTEVDKHKTNGIIGTWKMVYSEIKEGDSLQVKDLSKSEFIKIINKTHFAYFNQNKEAPRNFYGAGGTYTLKNNKYIETLTYAAWDAYRDKDFPFTIEIKKDTLIQYGVEEIKEANIKKYIVEKYIKIK
ncbi:lipocalin family protein [Flavivirga spongiicola]|uniref:Lipocalin-like domain-containing protein n=1 Tax=Flavivirga spongiicola TaxID=421621 RepID=A0ABU7XQP0_9FLAO|nr:lipocalin family protein [Flavivirga sp. MEBiC05379]MDO5978095.1 hypothetical protein [Flavivirga sp. MEBiC05379]